MSNYDSERLAALIGALSPPPRGWVEAAQELPRARREFDGIVARAEADAAFRARVVADLETALAAEGIEPSPPLLALLRARLSPG